eukprot:TRINITY_DN12033_c0_g1_i1.p1 TRINITY_DN12033_c0_g1~~TRINITY_DN12033_c0_g1_i1.p1  ORF type:complete len:260 (+),score=38.10 TRINITY_DN12033_c0_g1_i1:110-781(+)
MATITGFAHSYGVGSLLKNTPITVLEMPDLKLQTDDLANFTFQAPVGSNVTLFINATDYHATQSSTVTVPSGGLFGPLNELTLQVPLDIIYDFIDLAVRPVGSLKPGYCHCVVTVTAENKTMYDDPQGEPNATITLDPPLSLQPPIYFGVLWGITDPFVYSRTNTSADGGVLLINIPPQDEPYTVRAHKDGVVFTETQILCRADVFVNAGPPWGPRVIARDRM